jgi:hypothetical protein
LTLTLKLQQLKTGNKIERYKEIKPTSFIAGQQTMVGHAILTSKTLKFVHEVLGVKIAGERMSLRGKSQ